MVRKPLVRALIIIGVVVAVGALATGIGAVLLGGLSYPSAGAPGIDKADYPTSPLIAEQQATDSDARESAYSGTENDAAAPVPPLAPEAGAGDGASAAKPMIARNATIDLRVDDVDDAIDRVRESAKKHDADISELWVSGGDAVERPIPTDYLSTSEIYPASASVTLRVPAEKLDALSADLGKLGTVISQSSSASDVTQPYLDVAARLRNLKAEESRLVSFLGRTTKVSELLEVERELSRVRGEIEAMQSQVDYFERQVERATLTVSLSEPGPIVRPGGSNWGFLDAVTAGFQGAAAVLRFLITGLIALVPLFVIALVVWLVVRILRRRKPRAETAAATPDGEPDDDGTSGPAA